MGRIERAENHRDARDAFRFPRTIQETKNAPENKKGSDSDCESEPLEIILAATYVPTQLPVQYHRPCGA
jgi:hypothetical protein